MDWQQFLRTWFGTRRENQIARWTLPGLSVALAALAIHAATDKPVVVLAPPEPLDGEAQIRAGEAGASYKQAWGYHVATLLGNVHPGQYEATRRLLEPVLTSRTAPDIREQIQDQLAELKASHATVRYEPEQVTYREADDRVLVTGEQTVTPRGEDSGTSERRTYEVRIGMDRYRPQLLTIRSYEGGPRAPDEEADQ